MADQETRAVQETPLTETQARALAWWWGGCYRPENGRHTIRLPGVPEAIWTREQAVRVERSRPAINPGAVDWVG